MVNGRDVGSADVTPPGRPRMHDFALVVGVDHYPRFRSLHGAVNDARAFHAWVCDANGGGVQPDRARLIVSTATPAAPVQDQIDEALVELLEAADKLGGGHRLYFYFSGHGAMSPDVSGDDVALLLAKWSASRARLALSSQSYSGKLVSAGIFEELAVFLDCCRTTAVHAVGLPPTITYQTTSAPCPTRAFLAHSSEARRPSFEQPQGDSWHGVFTRCLLAILRRAPDGIDAPTLKDRLECEVAEACAGQQQAHVSSALPKGARFGRRDVLLRDSGPALVAPFVIESTTDAQITIYDAAGSRLLSSDGVADTALVPGEYRVQVERAGRIEVRLIDHGRRTHVRIAGPALATPAPLTGAATSHEYYTDAAATFASLDTCPPLGPAPHRSRLCIFLRREACDRGPRTLPSEPVTIHDVTGRRLTTLCRGTARVDDELGYVAYSSAVAPGTYRLRAAHTRRDVAITVPPDRAAHVFIADTGGVRLDDLRVALRPAGSQFEPASDVARAMESVIFALRTPDRALPAAARALLPMIDDDLCFGIASAHLLWRSRDLPALRKIMALLIELGGALPDVSILEHLVRSDDDRGTSLLELSAPPLMRASLVAAMTRGEVAEIAFDVTGAIRQAMRAGFHDSIWCTWSDRSWDARWIDPTVEGLRTRGGDAASIARTIALPVDLVHRTIEGLDATLPSIGDASGRIKDVHVPGYAIGEVLGRGSQGTVFHAIRDRDGRAVALKIVPLVGGKEQRRRTARELALVQRIDHPRIVSCTASGALTDDAGVWFELELCRGSVLELIDDAPMAPAMACAMVLQALDGLAYLHAEGIVHRDIKPGNLLVRDDRSIAIADLGLAKHLHDSLTRTGRAGGTAHFAPREQLLDFKRTLPASDVWSMAATLYFLLTLELPRDEYSDQTEIEAALENPIVPILERQPGLPAALARCLDRALSDSLSERIPDAAAFHLDLAAALPPA